MDRIELFDQESIRIGNIVILMDDDAYTSDRDLKIVLKEFKNIQHLVAIRVYLEDRNVTYLPIINIDGTYIGIQDYRMVQENAEVEILKYFRYYDVSSKEAGFEWEKENPYEYKALIQGTRVK